TRLMVPEEPPTALDVETQNRVLDVLDAYTAGQDPPSLVSITHDLAVAPGLSSDAVVMNDGHEVEHEDLHDLVTNPRNGYTQERIRAARAATVEPYVERFARELAAPHFESMPDERESAVFFDIGEVSRTYRIPGTNLFAKPRPKTALYSTSLVVHEGERIGIVGVSGSGKTTMLKLML